MKKIIVCDAIHNSGLEILKNRDDIEMFDASKEDKDKLLDIIGDYDVAITRSPTEIDQKFIEKSKNLKAVVRAGVGVDNVDIDGCSQKGIIVMNVPTANTIAAVELTMAHLISNARSFPYAHNDLKINRIWKREKWYGIELSGKKLGVIGFGNIGSKVAIRAKAFDMEVVTYDPYIKPSKATKEGIKYTTDFNEILSCDFITIHTPKTKETIDMISYDEIAKMKDGVRLINVARGGLYNEDALYDNLKSGKIAFAGIDVFNKEPAINHKLLDLDNITVTPHLGANTYESQKKIATQAVEYAISAAIGINYPNALNLPIKNEDISDFARPYLELISKLGFLAVQINKNSISAITIEANGEIAKFLKPLSTFGLVGALKESMGEKINYVNAIHCANEKNIEIITKEIEKTKGYRNRVIITISTDSKQTKIAGTVFDNTIQRIIEIDGVNLDIAPKGKMILFKNRDVPGVIAKISTILMNHDINISDFRLGKDDENSAIAVVVVDNKISKNILKELESVIECEWVNFIEI